MLVNLFEISGYKVTGLLSISTLEALIELRADCFILDEKLPYVSGHIICIMLKSNPATRSIPVILTSATKELENYATLCQAEKFLYKPFLDVDQILNSVAEVLSIAKNQQNDLDTFSSAVA